MMTFEDVYLCYLKYVNEFNYHKVRKEWSKAKQCNPFETEVLYGLLRDIKPVNIFEIGAFRGWSSFIMSKAIRANGIEAKITSFDINDPVDSTDQDYNDGLTSRKLIVGDVCKTIKNYDISSCDFMFIDADHRGPFGVWYSKEVLPLLKSGVVVYIHDWHTSHKHPSMPWAKYLNTFSEEAIAVQKLAVDTGIIIPIFGATQALYEYVMFYRPAMSRLGFSNPAKVFVKS